MRSFYRARIIYLGCAAAAYAASGAAAAAPAPPAYATIAAQSHLAFSGVQAGAPFTAVFRQFDAAIVFSPDALAESRFDVVIKMQSVDSQDADRDGTMRGADIFDVARWPTAHYVTRSFEKTAAGFEAMGSLTLRGVTRDVPIAFQFAATRGGATLKGAAEVKRLDFGVGQGDWKNTEWIGNDVKIDFSLALAPKH
ncbi:MAG TPA: YceI family protein [Steroidobacteraceae bacterium]|nr:YceI family protein [Steroidobacteraceae bacterium]